MGRRCGLTISQRSFAQLCRRCSQPARILTTHNTPTQWQKQTPVGDYPLKYCSVVWDDSRGSGTFFNGPVSPKQSEKFQCQPYVGLRSPRLAHCVGISSPRWDCWAWGTVSRLPRVHPTIRLCHQVSECPFSVQIRRCFRNTHATWMRCHPTTLRWILLLA